MTNEYTAKATKLTEDMLANSPREREQAIKAVDTQYKLDVLEAACKDGYIFSYELDAIKNAKEVVGEDHHNTHDSL